jgi:hypothetical protein
MSSFGSTEEVGAAKPLLVEVAISVCYPLASTTSGTPRARPRFSRAQRALEPPLREGLAGPGGAVVAGIRAGLRLPIPLPFAITESLVKLVWSDQLLPLKYHNV